MTTSELREDAIQRIKELPAGKLKVAAEFLVFLDERAGDDATRELLAVPELVRDVRKAKSLVESGEGVNWRTVRNDV
jgi:hypothetical protein